MEYDLTRKLILFIPVMKVKYIYTYETILDFKQVGLFLVCQGIWGLMVRAISFAERGVIGSQRPGNFLFDSVSLELIFTQKINQQHAHYSLLR